MAEENQKEMQEMAPEEAPQSEEPITDEESQPEEAGEMELTPEEKAMMEKAGIDESDLADLMSEIDEEPAPESTQPAPANPELQTHLVPESSDIDVTNLDLLMDVSLLITVELGRKDMNLGEVLKLGKGSLVELNKIADEPVDIFVNRSKIAEGEVVVVDDHFGVRITRILNVERLRRFG